MTRPGSTETTRVRKVRPGRVFEEDDVLTSEEPMEIRLMLPSERGSRPMSLSVTMRTPGNDFELAAGFLLTEGIVRGREDIEQIAYCVDPNIEQEFNIVSVDLRPGTAFDPALVERHFYTTSSCGVCGKATIESVRVRHTPKIPADRPQVSHRVIRNLGNQLRESQRIFARTGSLHAAGLFDAEGTLLSLREDVGRHNAVDKVIGQQLLADRLPLSDTVLMVSGRASFEILQKAAVAGVPVVVAVGAPSNLAVEVAKEFGMTLVGFAHGDSFNIYAGGHRLIDIPPPERAGDGDKKRPMVAMETRGDGVDAS